MRAVSDGDLDDGAWLTLVREALDEADQVPAHVVQAAQGVFTWRTIDVELAEITYDSTAADLTDLATRSQVAGIRALTFASSAFTIELEVTPDAVLGQLVPAPPENARFVVLLENRSVIDLEVDGMGCFTITPVPTGPFRLQLTGPVAVATSWITL